ncbi:MAG: hypothetical protein JO225_15970 [Candidatus Eremiobacteraeota bacterium]|nr:hypothetical protein [Candidatus Eremiobacteraeota bacterium]
MLTCSDSRVPADVVFDRGVGDLFVARTAGNVIDPIVIGSLQYARAHYHTNLLVVLGHEKCGAVEATLAWMQGATPPPPPFILSVTEAIKPAINTGMTVEEAVKANATYVAQRLRIPPDLRKMRVVPAYYTMSTGRVTYLPEPRSAG